MEDNGYITAVVNRRTPPVRPDHTKKARELGAVIGSAKQGGEKVYQCSYGAGQETELLARTVVDIVRKTRINLAGFLFIVYFRFAAIKSRYRRFFPALRLSKKALRPFYFVDDPIVVPALAAHRLVLPE